MNEWNIQSRAHGCQACGNKFSDKETYHTILADEKRSYTRLDVCAACWETQYGQGASDRKGFISYWQGIYEAPLPAAPEAIRKENAESLLRKLIELDDPKHGPAVYILAAMLERKRLLRVKEQLTRDDQRIFIYEHPKSGDIFTVPDPNLQLDQLDAVQRDVADLLEHGLNPPQDPSLEPTAESEQSPETGPTTSPQESEEHSADSEKSLPVH